ncbi:MAG: hypothetical protein U5M23_02125 [Marinagarivorans sp.]|nr:hypothetical protein [Marinagarivorans sp.]
MHWDPTSAINGRFVVGTLKAPASLQASPEATRASGGRQRWRLFHCRLAGRFASTTVMVGVIKGQPPATAGRCTPSRSTRRWTC